jgi:hypothetical protein
VNRRRLLLLVGALLVMLAAIDFWRRIYVPRDLRARDAGSFAPADVSAPPSVDDIRRELTQWLPGLQPVTTAADRPAETGWSLALLGVFDNRKGAFAVIRATPAGGGDAAVRQAAVGDELFGLRVADIQARRVVLTSAAGEQVLELFKPSQPPAHGTGAAPAARAATTAAVPGAAVPGAAAPAAGPAVPGAVTAQELQPGESLKLPGNLPVTEAKLPARDPNKKKPRLPSRPRPPQSP